MKSTTDECNFQHMTRGVEDTTMKNHKTTLLMFAMAISACDAPQDGETWRDMELESHEDVDRESLMDLVDQERWVDGLEELLDPVCDQDGCRWVWADLEGAGFEELFDVLPDVPEGLNGPDGPHTEAATVPNPAAAGSKVVNLISARCIKTQELGADEPYIVLNGIKVWSRKNFKNGNVKAIDVSQSYLNSAKIQLFEHDPIWDDKMGTFTVWSDTPNGEYYEVFAGSGGKYEIYFTVTDG